jgi:hypothetical protein
LSRKLSLALRNIGESQKINLNLAAEVDEDENGTSYGANEYLINKVEYTIAIRVALDSSKVIIKYSQKDGLETDCLPITEEIMKRIKITFANSILT